MNVPTMAAPPTPWSKNLAEPDIDDSAYIHSFSNLIGDVKVGAKVLIAPGTSIRADEGTPFYIGSGSNIQDGVVIHGLEQGRVIGDNNKEYSVWIGKQTCITHLALIHGPAYIGKNCFIGFRSTVFNARVGDGCIVMMHALIQDVEIPPGKYIPSGSVITNQQQADRLPDVQPEDREFAAHVVHINEALAAGYHCAEDDSCINPIKEESSFSKQSVNSNNYSSVSNMSLSSEIVNHVRSLLRQGCSIGAERANQRRFKAKSWLTCSITGTSESQILSELEALLKDASGEYVRLIGVDTQAKRRVVEMIIQRPGDVPGNRASVSNSNGSNRATSATSPVASNGVNNDLISEVRKLIKGGYQIGVEHATTRRYKAKSWITAPIINARSEAEALKTLNSYLADFAGEYVRLIGIDTNAKKRVFETIVQRPGEQAQINASGSNTARYNGSASNGVGAVTSGSLSPEVIQKVRSLLAQGYKIGTEHADVRRFKAKSWQSCSPIDSTRENEVIAALQGCVNEHAGEYVRLIGIDSQAKRRVLEMIIQRPGQTDSATTTSANTIVNTSSAGSSSYVTSNNGNGLKPEILTQVRSLLNQGYKIGTEHASLRRFKAKSWQSCSPIDSTRENEVIAALTGCIQEHAGEYVRLIGIDTQAKRRVLEAIIQRP